MKNFFILAVTCLSLTFLTSCSRDGQDMISSTREIVVRGEWTVDYYFNTEDRTALFNGATLTFRGDGSFIIEEGNSAQRGSWQMLTGVDRKEILQMELDGVTTHVQGLDAQWNVSSKGLSLLSMTDREGKSLRLRQH